jgi:hypothetical protein
MRSQSGGNDRDTVPGLGYGKQCLRHATFKQDLWLEPGDTAGSIEGTAKAEPAIQEKQRMRGQAADLDCFTVVKRVPWMAGGE